MSEETGQSRGIQVSHVEILVRYARNRDRSLTSEETGQSRGNSGQVCKKQRQISDLRRDRSVTWKVWSGMQETETDLRPHWLAATPREHLSS